ncbi:early nodulin-75-like [Teleopsis dalmanni]|uniref:early nodulin-75-like n=1 Tax=Teleopsis dalmanni TaxID=139649 RepID=UPI0018CF7CD6|nr:early nodulin-75-like [Teleopsis dalmanni]XP_037939058.1 early nodulin-75-like [Teleopsis dalmanni]
MVSQNTIHPTQTINFNFLNSLTLPQKTFILACFLVASASAAFIPSAQRQRRDVSELQAPAYSYLPPQEKLLLPETEVTTEAITEAPTTLAPASSVLGPNGYEYRTVRRLKYRYRNRRDVSHLAQHYLPPSNEYLPPAGADKLSEPAHLHDHQHEHEHEHEHEPEHEHNHNNDDPAPAVANEYLPPHEEHPSTEAAPLQGTDESEVPLAEVRDIDNNEPAATNDGEPITEEAPQDTAILADDGYHYKQPAQAPELSPAPEAVVEYLPPTEDEAAPKDIVADEPAEEAPEKVAAEEIPDESIVVESAEPVAPEYLPPVEDVAEVKSAPVGEYLPPLEEGVVVAEGPEESAILADDGYHYRAIKRLRF